MWRQPDDALGSLKIQGENHVSENQSTSLHRCRYGRRRDATDTDLVIEM
jgi:hypothetical protein